MTDEQDGARLAEQELYMEEYLIAQGGYRHDVWAQRDVVFRGQRRAIRPVVAISNESDPHYCGYMRTRQEVEDLVTRLRAAAQEAWPEAKS